MTCNFLDHQVFIYVLFLSLHASAPSMNMTLQATVSTIQQASLGGFAFPRDPGVRQDLGTLAPQPAQAGSLSLLPAMAPRNQRYQQDLHARDHRLPATQPVSGDPPFSEIRASKSDVAGKRWVFF